MKKFGEGQQPFHAIIDIPEGDSQELTTVTDQALNSLYGELFNLLQTHGINPTATTNADLKQVTRAVWSAAATGMLFIDSGSANNKILTHVKSGDFLYKEGVSNDNGFTVRFINKAVNTGAVTINVFDVENNKNHFNLTPLVQPSGEELTAGILIQNSMIEAYYDKALNKFILVNVGNMFALQSHQDGLGDAMVAVKKTYPNTINRTQHDVNNDAINIFDFGAKCDGNTDDTQAIQNAVNACISKNKPLHIPRGLTGLGLARITKPITINSGIMIKGDSYNYSGLLCDGCDGFVIDAGVNLLTIKQLAIIKTVRYSVDKNNNAAIRINATPAKMNYWATFKDLLIDGFGVGIEGSYFWSTLFNNVIGVFLGSGIVARGKCVNNFVGKCQLGGTDTPETLGIFIAGGNTATEGWVISNNLISNFGTAIGGEFCSHVTVTANILDFCLQRGIFAFDNASGGSLNWNVTDNYIATQSDVGLTAIYLRNNYSPSEWQNKGHYVSGNTIVQYSGASWSYGMLISGTAERNTTIDGNRVSAGVYACSIDATVKNITIVNNKWLNGAFDNKNTTTPIIYANNTGNIASGAEFLKQSNGKTSFYYGSKPPTAGEYVVGDIVWNITPSVSGYAGWVCVTGGGLGAWQPFGQIGLQSATTPALGSLSSEFNTNSKYLGKQLINTTDNKLYYATGGANNSPWRSVDGSTAITPV